MIIVDTSGALALFDRGEPTHKRVQKAISQEEGPLILVDLVLAELDYLILSRLGAKAERAFLKQLLGGAFVREPLTETDIRRALLIAGRYEEHGFGLTDAALMAVAERLGTLRILTLDHRHFGLFRDHKGRAFELVPG
jgi:predicted nucleic acid-binding protein